MNSKKIKWVTLIAILVLMVASIYSWWWVWGLLFIWWAAYDAVTGWTFLVEKIERRHNPVMFWLVTLLWFGYGVYVFSSILM